MTTGVVPFRLAVDERTEERLRWYAEDFLDSALDPTPGIAADVEDELLELGERLFREVFGQPGASAVAAAMSARRGALRIEIVADTLLADSLPWELLRDPAEKVNLALQVSALTRTTSRALPRTDSQERQGPVRLLLVISRPGGTDDTPFRSVAGPVVRQLAANRGAIQIEVLRPPTFERLQEVLDEAHRNGRPFDLVHFDGHGIFDLQSRRCYLMFHGDDADGTRVTGELLGAQLADAGVPMLVMNACRSAFGHHQQVYGSIAREVLECGVGGVVAMRFNVYVKTAALFVAALYRALASGIDLATAVTVARRTLADPQRARSPRERAMHDWYVPALYQSRPTRLLQTEARSSTDHTESFLPPAPSHGFVDRDVLIQMEGLFGTTTHIGLQGFAGSGKTSMALECARWYVATGGCGRAGPYLCLGDCDTTSNLILRIADQLLTDTRPVGIDNLRARVLDAVDAQRPLLIWDEVDSLGHEATELLADIGRHGGRVILISDRPASWPDIPVVLMPAMLPSEALELMVAVGGAAMDEQKYWQVLEASQGNPLAIETVTHEVRRRGLSTHHDVAELLQPLGMPRATLPAGDWLAPIVRVLDVATAPPDTQFLAQFSG